jgi:hypothetical protein
MDEKVEENKPIPDTVDAKLDAFDASPSWSLLLVTSITQKIDT